MIVFNVRAQTSQVLVKYCRVINVCSSVREKVVFSSLDEVRPLPNKHMRATLSPAQQPGLVQSFFTTTPSSLPRRSNFLLRSVLHLTPLQYLSEELKLAESAQHSDRAPLRANLSKFSMLEVSAFCGVIKEPTRRGCLHKEVFGAPSQGLVFLIHANSHSCGNSQCQKIEQ